MKTIISTRQQLPRFIFTLILLSVLSACGGSGATPTTPPALSNNAQLESLELSSGGLNPTFKSDIMTGYTHTTTETSITITATTKAKKIDYSATTTNGETTVTTVIDSTTPNKIPLSIGENTITITVIAEDGSTGAYVITITRQSTGATLSELKFTAGTLSPLFSQDQDTYELTIAEATTSVTATPSNPQSTVKVNGVDVASPFTQQITLKKEVGETITIEVKPEAGDSKTYSVKVLNDNPSLSELSFSNSGAVSPAFEPGVIFDNDPKLKNFTLPDTTENSITITAKAYHPSSTMNLSRLGDASPTSGTGSVSATFNNLVEGENTITLVVTAEGKSTQTYNMSVTYKIYDASLSSLEVTGETLSPAFVRRILDYKLMTTQAAITVTATSVEDSIITINSEAPVSGTGFTKEITLSPGENIIKIVVEAGKGKANADTKTYTITANQLQNLELSDPDPVSGTGRKFGEKILQLGNGNILVHVQNDTKNDANSGAIYLYQPFSQSPYKKIYGKEGDKLGSGGIIQLENHNFLIVSPDAKNGNIDSAGSVMLVNGTSGETMATLSGATQGDKLGSNGIALLKNNHFVIASQYVDKIGASNIVDSGSVTLVNHEGVVIQTLYKNNDSALTGSTNKHFADRGVTVLSNGNFVVSTTAYKEKQADVYEGGLVQLFKSDGTLIKSIIKPENEGIEGFGDKGITPLKNDNFLIYSGKYKYNTSAGRGMGSVNLINGNTGEKIGDLYQGNESLNGDSMQITALENGNYVILQPKSWGSTDGEEAGRITLLNGTDGTSIKEITGTYADDFESAKVTTLKNGNFVFTAPYSDKIETNNGNEVVVKDTGSISWFNGVTGEFKLKQKGQLWNAGDSKNNRLGSGDVIELKDGRYVVASPDDYDHFGFVGKVEIYQSDGTLSSTVGGDGNRVDDNFSRDGLVALGNDKFVIISSLEDFASNLNRTGFGSDDDSDAYFVDVGSVLVVDKDGNRIRIKGEKAGNQFGNGGVTVLKDHNFAVLSTVGVGSVQLFLHSTAKAVSGSVVGDSVGDMQAAQVINSAVAANYFILSQPMADNNGVVDSGKIRIELPQYTATPTP